MDDESLSEWVARRDARIGRLRVVPIVPGGGPRASHVSPDAPRLVERWNGHGWEFHVLAANLAEAKRILYPEAAGQPASGPEAAGRPLAPGTGRHRKPRS
ncbi:hypothetical protein GL263_20060 [Streptomyces durbertensis]|uniref:Uncharacterized protein n=1 Tax=Streptomyces durbertensis TaxID=2448886 RepID=A0ABR6EKH8_9ACTN|nr:DUF6087 family protein [Streptomyces durbertensis]MBB1245830.1 hypothetical protein [Streptomyces durbertensis]